MSFANPLRVTTPVRCSHNLHSNLSHVLQLLKVIVIFSTSGLLYCHWAGRELKLPSPPARWDGGNRKKNKTKREKERRRREPHTFCLLTNFPYLLWFVHSCLAQWKVSQSYFSLPQYGFSPISLWESAQGMAKAFLSWDISQQCLAFICKAWNSVSAGN